MISMSIHCKGSSNCKDSCSSNPSCRSHLIHSSEISTAMKSYSSNPLTRNCMSMTGSVLYPLCSSSSRSLYPNRQSPLVSSSLRSRLPRICCSLSKHPKKIKTCKAFSQAYPSRTVALSIHSLTTQI